MSTRTKKPSTASAPRRALLAALMAAAVAAPPKGASASGGYFGASADVTSAVTAHRIVLAITEERTVLWDQLEYSGAPADFAWVFPAHRGAFVELSSDAWIEALMTATAVSVSRPQLSCDAETPSASGPSFACGCPLEPAGADDAFDWSGTGLAIEGAKVTIVHRATIGPYATVTIRGDDPAAITKWLRDNGYRVDTATEPVLAGYAAEGFDFIALRLSPGEGVSAMRPVRVVSPRGAPTVPLRMLKAGSAGAAPISLAVIGAARYRPRNFPSQSVPPEGLSWDYSAEQSNWEAARASVLGQAQGRTWLTAYAQPQALLSPVIDPAAQKPVSLALSDGKAVATIGEAYVKQALLNGETSDAACLEAFGRLRASDAIVAGDCLGAASGCAVAQKEAIDARELSCGPLSDVAAALVGLRPRDVWITRMEASLPVAALSEDLELEAMSGAEPVAAWLTPDEAVNAPCPLARSLVLARAPAWSSGVAGALALALGVLARRSARTRRARRPRRA
jgi:hypothetical protein